MVVAGVEERGSACFVTKGMCAFAMQTWLN